jgi:hypothetical protein
VKVWPLGVLVLVFVFTACDDDGTPTADDTPTITTSATAQADATATTPTGEQLLYARADHSIWLYDTESGTQSEIVPAGICPTVYNLQWRPDGQRFAFTCGPGVFVYEVDGTLVERLDQYAGAGWSPDGRHMLLRKVPDDQQVIDNFEDGVLYSFGEAGEPGILTTIVDALGGGFSPDGSRLVYRRPLAAPCAPGCETGLIVRDLATGDERAYGNYVAMDWVRDGTAMLVETEPPEDARVAITAAAILDLSSGQLEPVPALTGLSAIYPTVKNDTVISLGTGGVQGIVLSVVDIEQGTVAPIEGSTISFPSDHIPSSHITSTEEHIYWFDSGGFWYRANYDGSGMEEVGEAPTVFVQFSPGVAYLAYPTYDTGREQQATIVATIDGAFHTEIGSSGFARAWRPTDDR